MVTVHDGDDGSPLIQRVSSHLMENWLAEIIAWRTLTGDGTEKPVPPPGRLSRSMPTTPDSRLPVLAGVFSRPFLAADRSAVRAHDGYHAPERVLMRCDVAVDTGMDVTQALGHLIEHYKGFPFAGPSDWAHFLACLIAPLLGMAVDKTPLSPDGQAEAPHGSHVAGQYRGRHPHRPTAGYPVPFGPGRGRDRQGIELRRRFVPRDCSI